jgi:hypothetical protein
LYQPFAFGAVVGAPLNVGAVLSTLIPLTVVLDEFPAASVALPVTDCAVPSWSVDGGAQVTTPDSASLHAKLTFTSVLFHPCVFGAGVAVPMIVGAVLSIRIVMSVVVTLPASSAIVCARVVKPSAVTTSSAGQETTPERLSLHVQCTVTGPVAYQPSGVAGALAVNVGAVWSMLTPLTLAERLLSAASTAEPDTDCAAPSADNVVGAGHEATPDNASAHDHETVTGALNQPFTFAAGTTPLIDGAVLSTFNVVDATAEFPALSTAEPDTN